MPRSGRPAIDGGGMWTTASDGSTIIDAYYLKSNLAASDDYVVKPLPAGTAIRIGGVAYTSVTIWGSGLISFGSPTAAQISAFAAGTVGTNGKGFPGDYIAFGPLDASHQDIFAAYDSAGFLNIDFTNGSLAATQSINPPGPPDTSAMNVAFGTTAFTIYSGTAVYSINGHQGTVSASSEPLALTYDSLAGAVIIRGTEGNDIIVGTNNADIIQGLGGNDVLTGGLGNDTLDGGAGIDTAIYSAPRSQTTVTRNPDGSLTISSAADGTDTVSNVELFKFADGYDSFRFADPGGVIVNNFAVNAGGWSSEDKYPRHVADVNGDGYADIVGFGQAGTLVSFGSANGTFSAPLNEIANFGQAQGWLSDNLFHRQLIDVNHDGRADIVGFGVRGVLVSLAQPDGSFAPQVLGSTNFNPANGWSNQDAFARTLADVNGDGFADIIGFGVAGTFVALGKGDGTFAPAMFALANFGVNQGWTSDNTYHRTVADVNGDGRADVVGFGSAGTYVALGQADGTFAPAVFAQADFGTQQGWSSQDGFARVVGDVNGDGRADVVGFGNAGTYVAYGLEDGSFSVAGFDVANFGKLQGWTSDNILHRELADLNKDGRADIIGFGTNGVLVSTAFGG